MKNIEGVTNSFCSSSPLRKRRYTTDFRTNIQKIRRLCTLAQRQAREGVEMVQLEQQWTEALLELLDYGNSNVLKSFQYHLQMEEKEEFLIKQGMHLQQDEL
jgi:hypothetical protein